MNQLIPEENIENKILVIRGQKVMLDFNLAKLYGVPTWRLNEQVKRNRFRFSNDFMFSLTRQEILNISQIAICSAKQIKHSKNVNVFTEQGVAMLSSVLKNRKAVSVNIAIMRAFVKLRQVLATHKELASKFRELEGRVGKHDEAIVAIFDAIRKMMQVPETPKRRIGFIVDRKN
ncbi:MAG: ORF6N domain-containing protein [Candidatus Margulisiibacteriota bacterium]